MATVLIYVVVSALWARHVVAPRVPGWPRALAAAPTLPCTLLLPFLLFPGRREQPPQRLAYMFSHLFLGLNTCKVLALCLQRGPLAVLLSSGSPWKFYGAAMLPVAVVEGDGSQSMGGSVFNTSAARAQLSRVVSRSNCTWAATSSLLKGLMGWAVGCVLHASMVPAAQVHQAGQQGRDSNGGGAGGVGSSAAPGMVMGSISQSLYYSHQLWVPRWMAQLASVWLVQEALMVAATWLLLGWAMDAAAATAALCFDVSSLTSFNNPAASLSLTELWRCRWNVLVSHTLRWLIYDPIVEGSLVASAGVHGEPLRNSKHPAALAVANLMAQRLGGRQLSGQVGTEVLSEAGMRVGRKQAAILAVAAGEVERRLAPRRMVGVMAVFVSCGALHELAYWLANGHLTQGLKWMGFFTIQAVGILVQRSLPVSASSLVTMILQDSKLLHRYPGLAERSSRTADWIFTAAFVLPCLHWLWLPACKASPQTCFVP